MSGGGRSAFLSARLRAQETAFTRDQDLHAYKSIRDALKGTGQLEAARERVEKVTPCWTIHAPSRAYCPTSRRVLPRCGQSEQNHSTRYSSGNAIRIAWLRVASGAAVRGCY
jgi:hypothetical protein